MKLLILFGRIGDRGGLLIAEGKIPNFSGKEAGTPVLGFPTPLQKLPGRFSSEGLKKYPIS
jgi:hypothetical protein